MEEKQAQRGEVTPQRRHSQEAGQRESSSGAQAHHTASEEEEARGLVAKCAPVAQQASEGCDDSISGQ